MELGNKISLPRYWLVLGILFVSLVLRVMLVVQGGQYYFPDERRYEYSKEVASAMLQKNFTQAFYELTKRPVHFGYEAIAVIPALIQSLFQLTPATPAIFFSIFSVLNLYLIWKLALRTGIPEHGAGLALLISAASHSLLYYTRHLVPYDLAMFFGLLALYVGLGIKPGYKTSLACGIISSMCFITYNGYWPLASFAIIVHSFTNTGNKIDFTRKALLASLGFIFSFVLFTILTSIGSNSNTLITLLGFAQSIVHGSYAEGWSLPFEYLWHAEFGYTIILGALSLYGIVNTPYRKIKKLTVGAGGVIFIYFCLFIPTSVLHIFVVYGRLARQLMPFLILASAQGLLILINKSNFARKIATLLLFLIFIQAAWNYLGSYKVIYPLEFINTAKERYPGFEMSTDMTNTGAPPICKYGNFIVVNVKFIYPSPISTPANQLVTLLSAPHPINFLPYQYEGYTSKERSAIREEEVKMEVLQINSDAQAYTLFGDLRNCTATIP